MTRDLAMTTTSAKSGGTHRTRLATGALAVAAVLLAVVGTGGVAESQVAPPVVTASATDGLLIESGNCSGSSTFSLDPATVSVTRTGDTTNELHVGVAWSGTIGASVYGAPEGLVIPAGETTAVFEIESDHEAGTVTIEIGASPDPSAPYDIGDPSTATARVLQAIADPVCQTAVSVPTTTPPPSPQPRPAAPVTADPDYTG
ncbi:MAG TPA: hypothetical protein VNQ33_10520 [Acidimicrobiales bacterium]|nr:hypothetical protein [Acidimicrobiales bacterium]